MKVSFIICYSSTWPMTVFDKISWPEVNKELDSRILKQTNYLLKQIESIPINKEIILLDNSDDFVLERHINDCKVVKSFGSCKSEQEAIDLFKPIVEHYKISDKIDYDIKWNDQAQITSLAYQHGVYLSTGNYIVQQHNDTEYLFDFYSKESIILDAIKYLEENDYAYLSIDKKAVKECNFPEYNSQVKHCADNYWFLCRQGLYESTNSWIDWLRGDSNHLVTFACENNNLKYKHLPGYYENENKPEQKFWFNYYRLRYNLDNECRYHELYNKPFLRHHKGGTGLRSLLK